MSARSVLHFVKQTHFCCGDDVVVHVHVHAICWPRHWSLIITRYCQEAINFISLDVRDLYQVTSTMNSYDSFSIISLIDMCVCVHCHCHYHWLSSVVAFFEVTFGFRSFLCDRKMVGNRWLTNLQSINLINLMHFDIVFRRLRLISYLNLIGRRLQ